MVVEQSSGLGGIVTGDGDGDDDDLLLKSTTNPTAAMAEVIGLVEKSENQNHSRIYAPVHVTAIAESRAQDQTQTCITKTAETKTENPALRSGARVENLAFIQKAATFSFNAAINEFPAPTGSTRRSFDHVVRVKAVIVELYYGHFQDSRIHFGIVEDGFNGQEWKEGYTQNHDKSFTASIPYSIKR
ncbi:hypothetical protein Tco_1128774 [Tanacetum coccineum]